MLRLSGLQLATLASLCLGLVVAEDVITITGATEFDAVLKDNSFVVAEFYAPWYVLL